MKKRLIAALFVLMIGFATPPEPPVIPASLVTAVAGTVASNMPSIGARIGSGVGGYFSK